jgi:hypothetical protein
MMENIYFRGLDEQYLLNALVKSFSLILRPYKLFMRGIYSV